MQSAATDRFEATVGGVVGVRCNQLRRWRGAAAYTRGGCAPQDPAAVAEEGVLGAVEDTGEGGLAGEGAFRRITKNINPKGPQ
jgi:hypothetical protein